MTRSEIAATLSQHSYAVRGAVLRFELQWVSREPRWSGWRCVVAVQIIVDSCFTGEAVNLLLSAESRPPDLLRLLEDAVTEDVLARAIAATLRP